MKKVGIIVLIVIFIIIFLSIIGNVLNENKENIKTENVDNSSNSIKKEFSSKESPSKEIQAPFKIKTNVEGLKINITKIEKVDTLLKIYVKYVNNTGSVYDLCESLQIIIADGKQYEADTIKTLDFIENPLYELENGVTYESILCFPGIKSNQFNLVFKVNHKDIRINNIIIK